MTFQPLTTPVDYVLLAGERSPGLAEVTGADSVRELQERKKQERMAQRIEREEAMERERREGHSHWHIDDGCDDPDMLPAGGAAPERGPWQLG